MNLAVRRALRAALAPLVLILSNGCGYIGDPLPPALNLPARVGDLTVVERGPNLVAQFTMPKTTTEGLPLQSVPETVLYVGPSGAQFETEKWVDTATKITDDTGKARFDIPVTAFVGKDVVVALRLRNDRGRSAGWSNFITLPVTPPVARPEALNLVSDPQGVKLSWTGSAPLYRVYRKDAMATEFAPLGETSETSYIDATAEFAKPYQYFVQALFKTGDKTSESELSETKPITPADKFPPAVPRNPRVIVGTKSVELSWDRNTESDLAGYRLYRAEGDGSFKLIAAALAAPGYSDHDVKPGVRYRYRILSFDQTGNISDLSAPVEAPVP